MLHHPVKQTLTLLPEYTNIEINPQKDGYMVDGIKFYRTTSVLQVINKPALVNWIKKTTLESVRKDLDTIDFSPIDDKWIASLLENAKNASDKARDDAAEAGTGVHETLSNMFTGYWEDKDLTKQKKAAVKFMNDMNLTLEAVEVPLWNDIWRVGGTCDAIGRRSDNYRVIWDWKTGSGPWPEMAFQLGAYSGMIRRLTGERVAEAYVVHVKEDHYVASKVDDLVEAEEAFDVTAKLHSIMRRFWFGNKYKGIV